MQALYLPIMVKGPLLAAGLLVLVGLLTSQLVLRTLVATQERHLRKMALLEFAGLEATVGPFVVRDDIWEMFDLLDRVTRRESSLHPLGTQRTAPEAERRGQDLHWQVSLPEGAIDGLPAGQVRQIAFNLLLNASAAAGYGGKIGLHLAREADAIMLGIQDSGPGLPDLLRARLMSDAPVEPGGGVGLRLVRELVQGPDGRISLERTPEGVNEIRVWLPLKPAGQPDA